MSPIFTGGDEKGCRSVLPAFKEVGGGGIQQEKSDEYQKEGLQARETILIQSKPGK